MKKRISILALLVIAICSAMLLVTACAELKLTSVEVKGLGFGTMVVEGDDLDVNGIEVDLVYEDGSTRTVSVATDVDLKIYQNDVEVVNGKLDNTVGEKSVTVVYGGYMITVKYTVLNKEDADLTYEIYGFEDPLFLTQYESNIKDTNNEKSLYLDLTDTTYLVGNANPFHFLPKIIALNDNNDRVQVNRYLSASTVYEKQDGVWVKLEGTALTNTVTIDEINNTYLFSADAVGKEYKISVVPATLSAEEMEANGLTAKEIEFKVVDGYNVHNASEFAIIDNAGSNTRSGNNYWDTLDVNGNTVSSLRPVLTTAQRDAIKAVVVHGDIALKQSDLPSKYFYNANDSDIKEDDSDYDRTINSLRDSIGIYNLNIAQGDSFTIYGNYFVFDLSMHYDDNDEYASGIKLTTREGGNDGGGGNSSTPIPADKLASTLVANTALFTIGGGDLQTSVNTSELMGKFNIYNMKFIGNAQIEDTSDAEKFVGSISLTHDKTEGFYNKNVITQCFKTTYFTWGNMTLEDCKGYDSYNSNVHIWTDNGNRVSTNNLVKNSVFKYSSGPLFMLHQGYSTDANEPCNVELTVQNCELYTTVKATDAWFASSGYDVTQATELLALSKLFYQGGKSFTREIVDKDGVKHDAMNFICIMKGEAQNHWGVTHGKLTILDENGEIISVTDASQVSYISGQMYSSGGNDAPLFNSYAGNKRAFVNNLSGDKNNPSYVLCDINDTFNEQVQNFVQIAQPTLASNTSDIFKGKYITAHLPVMPSSHEDAVDLATAPRLCAMLEYFDYVAPANPNE